MTRVQARLRAAALIASARQARRDTDPIADGRKIGGRARVVPELPADLGPPVEITRDAIRAALLLDDARNLRRRNVARDLLLKEVIPAQARELGHRKTRCM